MAKMTNIRKIFEILSQVKVWDFVNLQRYVFVIFCWNIKHNNTNYYQTKKVN